MLLNVTKIIYFRSSYKPFSQKIYKTTMATHFCAAIVVNEFNFYYTENFVNVKSRTKVTGAFEAPDTVYETVQVSPFSAVITPFVSARHDLGVSEIADQVETRNVGTLINERWREVTRASNLFSIIFNRSL